MKLTERKVMSMFCCTDSSYQISKVRLTKSTMYSNELERSFRETQKARRHLVWECGCVKVRREGGREQEKVWVCFGEDTKVGSPSFRVIVKLSKVFVHSKGCVKSVNCL